MPDVSGGLPNTGSGTEAFAYIGPALLGVGLVLCQASHRLRASQLSRSLLGALHSLPLFAVQTLSASSIGVVV